MRYDELAQMVTGSEPADWQLLPFGPFYADRLEDVSDGDDRRWIEVVPHVYLAVFRADVSLRLAWGLKVPGELSFPGWTFPDSSIGRYLVDAFWQGALAARWAVLDVDGGNAYLPVPAVAYVKTGEALQDYEITGWTAKASEVALARLLDRLVRPSSEFDRYLRQAGIVEVPGE